MDNNSRVISFSLKRIAIILIVMVLVVIGGTFAWFSFSSKQSALVLTIGDINDTQIKLSPYQIKGEMVPVNTYTSGVYSEVEVSNGDRNTSVVLYYKINDLDVELIDNGLAYTVVDVSDNSVVENGYFSDLIDTSSELPDSVVILQHGTSVGKTTNYKVYLWLDSSKGNQSAVQGSNLDVELNGSITSITISGINKYGEVLTANIIGNSNSDVTYTYQWYSNTSNSTTGGTAISSENTTNSYTVGEGLVGKYIYVVVKPVGNNLNNSFYTDLTDSDNNNSNTVIKGDASITVSSSTITLSYPNASSFTYDFVGDGNITCSTGNSSIATCSVDTSLKKVTITPKISGSTTTVTLNLSSGVNYNAASKSVNVSIVSSTLTPGVVTISGTNSYNQTLTATVTTNTSPTADSYSYQWWYATTSTATSGTNISGATSSAYTIGDNLVGKYIGVTVTAKKNNYSDVSFSAITNSVVSSANNQITATSATIKVNATQDISSLISNTKGTLSYAIKSQTTGGSSLSGSILTAGALSSSNDDDGTVVVTVTDSGNAYYESSSVDVVFTVQKYTRTLSWDSSTPSNVTYGDTSKVVKANSSGTGGMSGTITYSSGTTTVLTVNSSTGAITPVSTGSSVVTASMARTTTVKAASISKTVTIDKGSCTCSITSIPTLEYSGSPTGNIVYSCDGDGTRSVTSGTTSVITVGSVGTTSTALTAKSTGSSIITVSQSAGTKYNACTSDSKTITVIPSTYIVTYDLSNVDFNALIDTTGEQVMEIPYDGELKLEVWGAQGASYNTTYVGGYGGYSVGQYNVTAGSKLYVNVGGQGTMATSKRSASVAGGTNGGGNGWGTTSIYVGGGGGATHIATSSGALSTFSSNQSALLIVAGGGGAAAYQSSSYYGKGGNGGGISGNNGTYRTSTTDSNVGKGGSQTAAGGGRTTGSFGLGGSSTSSSYSGTGGGGGYYGGGGGNGYRGGGGGSGYIGNSLLTNKAMYCYSCTTSSAADTLTYSNTNVSETATSNYSKTGNGAARLTLLSVVSKITSGSTYGSYFDSIGLSWIEPGKDGYIFKGWYDAASGGNLITSSTVMTKTQDHTLYPQWTQVYTVSYNANGGSGAPDSQTKTHDVALTLSSTVPTRTGYDFLGWSTSSTATSATYQSGETYMENESVTLYAVWEAKKYMIKYDLSNVDFYALIDTTGEQVMDIPYDGELKLEVWGAQGASYNSTYVGGYGGYSVGQYNVTAGSKLYVNVGGQGTMASSKTSASVAGGTNGGGNGWGTTSIYVGGGGGATHIATSSGALSTFSSNQSALLIVAGGGGAAAYQSSSYYGKGGNGGGISGNNGTYRTSTTDSNVGKGGSQTTAGGGRTTGGFGTGGSSTSSSYSGTGGGGGYYGGGGGNGYRGGGGGSGYIGNSLLTNKAMYCYSCTTSSAADTLTYSNTNVSETATSNYSKTGNGAARLTLLSVVSKITSGSTYGSYFDSIGLSWIEPEKDGYVFKGWYDAASGGNLITSSTVMTKTQDHTLYPQWQEAYTISYDANGGSGAPSSQKKVYGEDITLSSVEPTKEGYTFLGWSTSSTATSATYTAGSTYTANASAILYAVWKQDIVSPVSSYSCSNKKVGSSPYFMTYTGQCTMIDDGSNNWRVKFLTSGTLKFTSAISIDAFLVGGGGGGGNECDGAGGGGGGGGYTKTTKNISISANQNYSITVGSGGSGGSGDGGSSSAFSVTASGGYGGSTCGGSGGSGGSGGGGSGWASVDAGDGGSNGSAGGAGNVGGGSGQGTTTREFGASNGTLYAGGGGGGNGGNYYTNPGGGGDGGGGAGGSAASANTGGGGGGGGYSGRITAYGQSGGSGIVVIRNKR